MSNSSRDTSPTSEATQGRNYLMSRDNFAIELPSPRLQASNGQLKSPNSLKSPTDRRAMSFSREGILGSAQKARNLSQSSGDRDSATAGLNSRKDSDDGINPLKRRSTDAGSDYPRRRATIAVCIFSVSPRGQRTNWLHSARFAGRESLAAMVRSPNAAFAWSSAQNASIVNLESSLTQATS
jgi:hypothetical protein